MVVPNNFIKYKQISCCIIGTWSVQSWIGTHPIEMRPPDRNKESDSIDADNRRFNKRIIPLTLFMQQAA